MTVWYEKGACFFYLTQRLDMPKFCDILIQNPAMHKRIDISISTLQVYKVYLTKLSNMISVSVKMCSINIHLTINTPTFIKYCINKLLYKTVTHYQNKTLYNKVFFGTNFMHLQMFLHIHITHPKFYNINQVIQYDTSGNSINNFVIF